jgi:hypothetical protein
MTDQILKLLIEERTRLQNAIDALKGEHEAGLPDWVSTPKKKTFSAATRRKMAEGQKRRYAERKAAESKKQK